MILYVSTDDGTLYDQIDMIDNVVPLGYYKIEVPDKITLNAERLCGGYGSIVEILMREGLAKKVK